MLDYGVSKIAIANTLVYFNTTTITTVKSLTEHAPEANIRKEFA